MEYQIEKWEAMDLLVHAKTFHAETSEKEIPVFWDEYYENEEYRKIPGYLGIELVPRQLCRTAQLSVYE